MRFLYKIHPFLFGDMKMQSSEVAWPGFGLVGWLRATGQANCTASRHTFPWWEGSSRMAVCGGQSCGYPQSSSSGEGRRCLACTKWLSDQCWKLGVGCLEEEAACRPFSPGECPVLPARACSHHPVSVWGIRVPCHDAPLVPAPGQPLFSGPVLRNSMSAWGVCRQVWPQPPTGVWILSP